MRCQKEAIVLIQRGYKVHLIANKLTQYSDLYETTNIFQDIHQLRKAVLSHKDADIFHCHNEPSWFVTVIKEMLPDKKVVIDVHDSMLLRRSQEEVDAANDPSVFRISVDERNNFQLADGLIYVCDPMKEMVNATFGLTQPCAVVPSAVPRQFYRIDFIRWQGGLVYEGRIDAEKDLDKEWGFFRYCNYVPLAKECKEKGIPFYIYTPRKNESVRSEYEPHAILHEPLAYDKFIKEIGCHDWGLVGNSFYTEEWKNALPNKLFEYMAGCVPIVCWNADHSWEFIKDTGMGIRIDSLDELKQRWREHEECRKNLIKRRMDFCLENYMDRVETLYKEVLG